MTGRLDAMLERERVAAGPRHWVRVGTACNNRCLFCLDGEAPRDLLLTPEEVDQEIVRGRRQGAERLILSGGEPTVHPDFVELIRRARGHGYRWVQTVTNGCNLADRGFFDACVEAGLDEVTFSLHGHTPQLHDRLTRTEGSFRRLMKGLLRAIRDGRFVVSVDVVICRQNVHHLRDILELALAAGVREFDLLQIIPHGSAYRHRRELLYDPGEHLPGLHRVLQLNRHPGVVLWTNRLPAMYLEGLEELIQDPHKFLDEVNGRRTELRRYLDRGVALPCRDPDRCPHCFVEPFCTAVDRIVADLHEARWHIWWLGDSMPEGLEELPFGCRRLGLAINTLEDLRNLPLPQGVGLYLEVARPGPEPPQPLDNGAPVTLVADEPQHLERWLQPMQAGIELEIRLNQRTARWMTDHRDRLASSENRVRIHQPSHETLAEAVTNDVQDPGGFFRELALPLKVSGLPPCVAPGALMAPAPNLLPARLFEPESGRLDLVALGRFFIREHYRVKSLRCAGCAENGDCEGGHINLLRAQGLELLQPLHQARPTASPSAEPWIDPTVGQGRPAEAAAPILRGGCGTPGRGGA